VGALGATEIWRPLTVRTDLGYENNYIVAFLISYKYKYEVTFREECRLLRCGAV
jgi:hypothetical protein